VKRGRRGKHPVTELGIRYENEGLTKGLTVAEWEQSEGLPPYSCYPEAKGVKFTGKGYFMYRNATPEEKVQMSRGTFRKDYGDIAAIEVERAKKREYWKEHYRAKKAAAKADK
jgi:hypothetical protein